MSYTPQKCDCGKPLPDPIYNRVLCACGAVWARTSYIVKGNATVRGGGRLSLDNPYAWEKLYD